MKPATADLIRKLVTNLREEYDLEQEFVAAVKAATVNEFEREIPELLGMCLRDAFPEMPVHAEAIERLLQDRLHVGEPESYYYLDELTLADFEDDLASADDNAQADHDERRKASAD